MDKIGILKSVEPDILKLVVFRQQVRFFWNHKWTEEEKNETLNVFDFIWESFYYSFVISLCRGKASLMLIIPQLELSTDIDISSQMADIDKHNIDANFFLLHNWEQPSKEELLSFASSIIKMYNLLEDKIMGSTTWYDNDVAGVFDCGWLVKCVVKAKKYRDIVFAATKALQNYDGKVVVAIDKKTFQDVIVEGQ